MPLKDMPVPQRCRKYTAASKVHQRLLLVCSSFTASWHCSAGHGLGQWWAGAIQVPYWDTVQQRVCFLNPYCREVLLGEWLELQLHKMLKGCHSWQQQALYNVSIVCLVW